MNQKQLKTLVAQNVCLAKSLIEIAQVVNAHADLLTQFVCEIQGLNEDINTLSVAIAKIKNESPLMKVTSHV